MRTKKMPLDFASYWNTVGTDNVAKIIETLGSSMRYFHAVKNRRKAISPKRAQQIIDAANLHTPGFAPDFTLMVLPIEHVPSTVKGWKTPPSPAYLKAQKARKAQVTAA